MLKGNVNEEDWIFMNDDANNIEFGNFKTIKIKDLSLEELYGSINIQAKLTDLQSKDRKKIKIALQTLSAMAGSTERKDCLYALAGYYQMEIKTLDDIEFFFRATKISNSLELIRLILTGLTKNKDASRRRIFMDDVLRQFELIIYRSTRDQVESFIELIESSEWGDKQKDRFLEKLYSYQNE